MKDERNISNEANSRSPEGSAVSVPAVRWFDLLATISAHAGGFNIKTVRLIRDYWTIYRSRKFDPQFYYSRNPDVASTGLDPLVHYLAHGESEGRSPSPALSGKRLAEMFEGRVRSRRNRLAALVRGELPPKLVDHSLPAENATAGDEGWQLPEVRPQASDQVVKTIVVYTAIFDGYDKLTQPDVVNNSVDYVCFSDRQIPESGAWQVRSLDYFDSSPRRMARYAKLHPHRYFPDYEWSLWVDGRVAPRIDPLSLTQRQGDGALFAFHHPDRSNPYDEATEVIRLQLDRKETVEAQMNRYEEQGFRSDVLLHETNVLLRRHMSPSVIHQSHLWWSEIERGSIRDQLSFDYAAWKTGVEIVPLADRGVNVRNDARFRISKHRVFSRAETTWTSVPGQKTLPPIPSRPIIDHAIEREPVDIVVCVHNALPEVRRCLESIDDSRDGTERLIVIDDGSDTETKGWLLTQVGRRFEGDLLIRREEAGGYTVAANTGLNASSAPNVVMLNSDTIVPRSWLTKLRRAVHSAPEVGLIGPLSNAASYQSVPQVVSDSGGFMVNALPPGLTVGDVDAVCEAIGRGLYPRVPTLNGFCMLMRRALINKIGVFDELNFPRGYGEENDYCFRATEAGFSAIVACDTYVFHAKSRSYTTVRRNELARIARNSLTAKWSEHRVRATTQALEQHPWLASIRRQVAVVLEAHPENASSAGADRHSEAKSALFRS
jgi:O-antigen biosynthesis protein